MIFDQPCNYNIILGGDFLCKIGMNLNYKYLSIEWLGNAAPMDSLSRHPVNWSEGKGKKETKMSCKNCHGVADLEQIWFMISELSQLTDKKSQERTRTTAPKALVSSPFRWVISSHCPDAQDSIPFSKRPKTV